MWQSMQLVRIASPSSAAMPQAWISWHVAQRRENRARSPRSRACGLWQVMQVIVELCWKHFDLVRRGNWLVLCTPILFCSSGASSSRNSLKCAPGRKENGRWLGAPTPEWHWAQRSINRGGFEPSRVQNVRHFLRIGMVALIGRVARAGPVAPLAGDAEDETIPVVRVTGIGFRFEPGCVALQASGDDAAGEVHLAVGIARAVDPPLLLREVGDGQLVEAVALPEEIGLADLSGAGDNVDALGPPVPTLPFSDDGRLIETGFVGGDFEAEIGIAGPDGGVVRRETAQN